jgi:L-fuconolactonase
VSSCEIVDSHHHLWDTNALRYTLFETIPQLQGAFTVDAYEREAQILGVGRSICVEAASAGVDGRRETEWLLQQIGDVPRVAALIAWAPLERRDLDQYLGWLLALEGKPIVGIRRSFEFEHDDFPQRAEVIDGGRLAGERGLVLDLVLFSRSLRATIRLVDSCPATRFVLDHLGKPPIRKRRPEPWASELRELALRPNVVCKLSGLPTEADRANWMTVDLRPYVEHALDCFGPDRLLFGSDWPVVKLAGGLERWHTAVGELLASLDEADRSAILGKNACRVYGLPHDRRSGGRKVPSIT